MKRSTFLQRSGLLIGSSLICNGAVCGAWWKGPYQKIEPAYTLMELFDDGSSKRTIINYKL